MVQLPLQRKTLVPATVVSPFYLLLLEGVGEKARLATVASHPIRARLAKPVIDRFHKNLSVALTNFKASTPTTVNTTATTVDSIIQTAIMTVAVNAAYTATVAEFPFLGLPIISWIYKAVLDKYAGYIATSLEQVATFQIIDAQTSAEAAAANAAATALQTAMASGDQAAIAAQQATLNAAIAALVHWDGST